MQYHPLREEQEDCMDLNIRPLEHIGVEVLDVDLGAPVDGRTRAALEALWLEHGVLVFLNQNIDVGQQIAFSELFGDPGLGLRCPERNQRPEQESVMSF